MASVLLGVVLINKNDFTFVKLDTTDGHKDFWFEISGNTREVLTRELMETGMRFVSGCVYSQDEDVVGVERVFMFNKDVIIYDDKMLKATLKELVAEYER